MSQSIITLGIGGTANLDWFITSGLHAEDVEITGIIDLTLRPRTFTVTVYTRSNGLTLRTRSFEMSLPERP